MKAQILIAAALFLCLPASGQGECTAPNWADYVPHVMHEEKELLSFLDQLYDAHCRCVFSDSIISRLTSGGGGAVPPSRSDAVRRCAGAFRFQDMIANSGGTMGTVFALSPNSSLFGGDEIQMTVVFIEGKWRAYLPAGIVPVLH